MNSNEIVCFSILGVGLVVALYWAMDSTQESGPIPAIQGEDQMMGIGGQAGMKYGEGTPLDCRPEVHFWSPGLDSDASVNQVVKTPHRYPAVPGGNISTVMHHGWSVFNDRAPANNDWFMNPPEVAVL
jgi:hypothetical protein